MGRYGCVEGTYGWRQGKNGWMDGARLGGSWYFKEFRRQAGVQRCLSSQSEEHAASPGVSGGLQSQRLSIP